MAKQEQQSDFTIEYSTYYVLKNGNSIWGTPTGDKCHFHTPDEIKMLMEISQKHPEWKVVKDYYPKPIRI